jgi:hypothetical protein
MKRLQEVKAADEARKLTKFAEYFYGKRMRNK